MMFTEALEAVTDAHETIKSERDDARREVETLKQKCNDLSAEKAALETLFAQITGMQPWEVTRGFKYFSVAQAIELRQALEGLRR
ncbi:MAG: hypothetical protein AAF125_08400 [Chloroflexota bacterium]